MTKFHALGSASESGHIQPVSSASSGVAPLASAVRRTIYSHDTLTPNDMALVFGGIRKQGRDPGKDWTELFCEALTDYVVHQNEPPDYIASAKADWLIAELRRGGGISTKAEFAMLIDVMSHALDVPPPLSAFALSEIADAIKNGRRAFADEDHPAGIVTRSDAEALKTVLFAATTGETCHVTREEAEILFDIAHATAAGEADPAFDELFARAIGNHLMAISLHVPTAAEELHRQRWLSEREALPGFFSRIAGGKAKASFLDVLKSPLQAAEEDMAKLDAKDDAERAQTETITGAEADWIIAHLTRDGKLTSAETRLLQWLGAEAHALPPPLKTLADKANAATTASVMATVPKHFGHRHAISSREK